MSLLKVPTDVDFLIFCLSDAEQGLNLQVHAAAAATAGLVFLLFVSHIIFQSLGRGK